MPDGQPEPGDRRPAGTGRSLDEAPGARYREAADDAEPTAPPDAGIARAVSVAALTGFAGAGLIVVLGGVVAVSAGLIAVAGLIGWVAGQVMAALVPSGQSGLRRGLAVSSAVDAVLFGQIGLWLYAQSEGGALGLVDYAVQTWGVLIPAQFLAAVIAAWIATRR